MRWITLLLTLINALLADRSRLALENVALRQQLTILSRSVKRAKIDDSDRVFWILMRRLVGNWRGYVFGNDSLPPRVIRKNLYLRRSASAIRASTSWMCS